MHFTRRSSRIVSTVKGLDFGWRCFFFFFSPPVTTPRIMRRKMWVLYNGWHVYINRGHGINIYHRFWRCRRKVIQCEECSRCLYDYWNKIKLTSVGRVRPAEVERKYSEERCRLNSSDSHCSVPLARPAAQIAADKITITDATKESYYLSFESLFWPVPRPNLHCVCYITLYSCNRYWNKRLFNRRRTKEQLQIIVRFHCERMYVH